MEDRNEQSDDGNREPFVRQSGSVPVLRRGCLALSGIRLATVLRRIFPVTMAVSIAVNAASATPGQPDPSFDAGSAIDGQVQGLAIQPDGKVLLWGGFTTVPGGMKPGLARLNPDGSVDDTFTASEVGNVLGIQADHKLLVAALITDSTTNTRLAVVRLGEDGSRDPSYVSQPVVPFDLARFAVRGALQSDGKLILPDGVWGSLHRPARLNADGSVDSTFGAAPLSGVPWGPVLILEPDGRLVVGDYRSGPDGVWGSLTLVRLNADGSTDRSFHPDLGANFVEPVILGGLRQADSKLLLWGKFLDFSRVSHALVRLNADGSVDPTFESTEATVRGVTRAALTADERLLVLGSFAWGDGLARLRNNGNPDDSFLPVPLSVDGFPPLALQPDGGILIAPYMGRDALVRVTADGRRDTSFPAGAGPDGPVGTLAAAPDGSVIVTGGFSNIQGLARSGIARLNRDGRLDRTYPAGSGVAGPGVTWTGLQADGKLVVAGSFEVRAGQTHRTSGVARLRADGSLDESFANPIVTTPWTRVSCAALLPGGSICLGGQFSTVGGLSRTNLARITASGQADPTFAASVLDPDSQPRAMAVQPDGKLLVAGYLLGVLPDRRVAGLLRLEADGSLDTSFTPRVALGSFLRVEADGKILFAGMTWNAEATPTSFLTRLGADGSPDSAFHTFVAPGVGDGSMPVAVQTDGRILLAAWSRVSERPEILRLGPEGEVDSTFAPLVLNGTALALAVGADGRAWVAGQFSQVNDLARAAIARFRTEAEPTLRIVRKITGVLLEWDEADLTLESAGSLPGPFERIPGARSGYAADIASGQHYFRLVR